MTSTADNISKKVPLALLAAVSLLVLSGCVSEVQEAAADLKPTAATAPENTVSAASSPPGGAMVHQAGYVDPVVASAASGHRSQPNAAQSQYQPIQPTAGETPQMAGLVTQPTGISAGSQSIFSSAQGGPASAANTAGGQMNTGSVPAYAPTPKISPALNSVYSAPAAPVAYPQPVTQQRPLEHSANSQSPAASGSTENLAASVSGENVPPDGSLQSVPIAAFFAGAAKKRTAAQTSAGTQIAALPRSAQAGIALAGRATMTDEFDDSHTDDDDKPAGLMKLASLSGLSRVMPNGLVLQTEQVNVGCFKPELIRRIKEVESHYQRPAIITSGYRPPKGATQHSKHYTCEAADIQVKGVSKWELAEYLRSLPDRGGVGTYCHTESVHLDLGEPRDWNWRCRRTAQNL
ncbi:DUF882 domain-containing protein [Agrobacterium larrymoorei]|uniref:YcbK family protein n=1 Tax=Agrobacterium larrymoorei TaxID=160699 RepID=UPI001573A861|nr:D-Ala-D-Ala carboxypeptidase family metallohydrolase [Agrobacterium larrymoorei]NTJ42487.1 DUF882 domain-containing protein [Agrobacterium larrymoorei]